MQWCGGDGVAVGRWGVVGDAGPWNPLFSDDAAELIHRVSAGLPPAVNNLAIQALIAAFATNKSIVDCRRSLSPSRRHRGHDRLTGLPKITNTRGARNGR